MPEWTKQQRAAIEAEGGSLLVSAAAGSGKTAVLVERAVRLIAGGEAPLPADRLLILTFTNAAAEELRARIAARLEEEVRARPGDMLLRRQRLLLRRAFIGTIDAFCVQLVRENFQKLGVAPDVAVGDGALLGQLSEATLAATMEEMYEREDFSRLAALYGNARSDMQTEEAILALYSYTRTLPRPAEAMAGFLAMYEGDEPFVQTPWGGVLLGYAEDALTSGLALLREALAVIDGEQALLPYVPALEADEAVFSSLLAAVRSKDWNTACALAGGYSFPRLGAVRGFEGEEKQRAATLRAEAKSILSDMTQYCFAATEAQFEEDRAAALPLVRALVDAAALYGEKLAAAKAAERVLDFADFEHLALALLQDEAGERTPDAARISGKFGAVMVDEYQDTNELQSALYESLSDEAGENLFYVGDVKQSIYRFRLANPGIFLAKKTAWTPFGEGWPAVLTLGHNFRSGKGVVEGVNYLFGQIMSPALGEVAYGEGERLIQGAEGGDALGVEICAVEDAGDSDAAYIAHRIKEMVAAGYPVRDKGGERPCSFGDFAILLRSRTRMSDYLDALEACAIPVASDASDELLDTPEVLPLAAALAAIGNPGDEVNLAATLMGPLFRFSPDEMTALRAAVPEGGLWGALVQSDDAKVRGFVAAIGQYRALSGQMPVGRLCEILVEETGYLSAVASMEGGLARRENLLRFIGWAKQVSANGRGTLHGFLRLLQSGRAPDSPGFKAVKGHVSLLTIHKSKGLEFPVVFLAGAARRFNMMDTAKRVQMHRELGLGLWLGNPAAGGAAAVLYPTLPLLAVRRASAMEALSEEMRVLYVALTRAREKIILTFGHRDPARLLTGLAATLGGQAPGPFQLARAGSYAGWVLSAVLRHPDAAPLLLELGCGPVPQSGADCRLGLTLCKSPESEACEPGPFAPAAAPDEELVARLRAGFAQSPARLALAALPAKVSVSQLAKREVSGILARPDFMFKSGLTAAERGTAMHSFLQHADYPSAARDLEWEIKHLSERDILSPEAAKTLDRAGLRAFLASPLAGRIAAAGQVLREYDFITAIPAGELDGALSGSLAREQVLVQGIADAVLVSGGGAEIVDYKTDRGKTAAQLADFYRSQLALYAAAVEKRLCLPVKRLTIWSFALAQEIDIRI